MLLYTFQIAAIVRVMTAYQTRINLRQWQTWGDAGQVARGATASPLSGSGAGKRKKC